MNCERTSECDVTKVPLKLRIGRDTFLDLNAPAVSSCNNLEFNS
jgi:hypothetical protein